MNPDTFLMSYQSSLGCCPQRKRDRKRPQLKEGFVTRGTLRWTFFVRNYLVK